MTTQWITDRLPTEADAHPVSKEVLACYENIGPVGMPWQLVNKSDCKYQGFIPLNDLPPVPVVKNQAVLDSEEYTRRWGESVRFTAIRQGSCVVTWYTSDVWHSGILYAREDLKRQVREIIATETLVNVNNATLLSSHGLAKLRELVKE